MARFRGENFWDLINDNDYVFGLWKPAPLDWVVPALGKRRNVPAMYHHNSEPWQQAAINFAFITAPVSAAIIEVGCSTLPESDNIEMSVSICNQDLRLNSRAMASWRELWSSIPPSPSDPSDWTRQQHRKRKEIPKPESHDPKAAHELFIRGIGSRFRFLALVRRWYTTASIFGALSTDRRIDRPAEGRNGFGTNTVGTYLPTTVRWERECAIFYRLWLNCLLAWWLAGWFVCKGARELIDR